MQFGGQTPLNLARALATAGVPIIGTSVDTIEAAEDREKFQQILTRWDLKQPANGIARTMSEARAEAAKIGFPALVRPSFVLGGRAMEICYDQQQFEKFVAEAFVVAQGQPVLIDRFLEDATEVDVDAICDGEDVVVAGHYGTYRGGRRPFGRFGLCHSTLQPVRSGSRRYSRGDDADGAAFGRRGTDECAICRQERRRRIRRVCAGSQSAREPTVPFVAKATGLPVAKIAAKVMAGCSLRELGRCREPVPAHVSVKESVFPFRKFAGVDMVLGPEMRSTGEVMGISERFSIAFAKSQFAAGVHLPASGRVFISVADRHKQHAENLSRRLQAMGYDIIATSGTAKRLETAGIRVERVKKIAEGHPNLLDHLIDGNIALVLNTPKGKGARTDEGRIRAATVQYGVPCITTIQAAEAAVMAMEALREEEMTVQAIQDRLTVFS